ncbi:MAG: Glucosamine-6-phosphate deaminase [Ktedonobacterales bacterium]|jgi:glucosamine-6-phosphate deaminase|nr:MAG: Glucosamine-6-phosphate deaminase [Ktedonobacterales bacterium]
MRLIVAKDYAEMSRCAALLVAEAIAKRPFANIVVPVGATPIGFYRELTTLHRQGIFDASRLRVFQLDEYGGVARDDPRAFSGWIARTFLEPLGIPPAHVVLLDGEANDPHAACQEYDETVTAAGGFDIAVLGLGANGHIGFNEPPADPDSPSRVVRLSAETRAANALYWGERTPVPTHAMTCGMAHLLAARQTLLLVAGAGKCAILRRAVVGPVTPDVPASYVCASEQVTILADAAAWPEPIDGGWASAIVECGDI